MFFSSKHSSDEASEPCGSSAPPTTEVFHVLSASTNSRRPQPRPQPRPKAARRLGSLLRKDTDEEKRREVLARALGVLRKAFFEVWVRECGPRAQTDVRGSELRLLWRPRFGFPFLKATLFPPSRNLVLLTNSLLKPVSCMRSVPLYHIPIPSMDSRMLINKSIRQNNHQDSHCCLLRLLCMCYLQLRRHRAGLARRAL